MRKGIQTKTKRRAGRFEPIGDNIVEEWVKLRKNGISTTEIARKAGVHASTVINRTNMMTRGVERVRKKETESYKAQMHSILYALGSSSGWVSRTDYDYGSKYRGNK